MLLHSLVYHNHAFGSSCTAVLSHVGVSRCKGLPVNIFCVHKWNVRNIEVWFLAGVEEERQAEVDPQWLASKYDAIAGDDRPHNFTS